MPAKAATAPVKLAGSVNTVVRRTVPARRELVWELWTDASRMSKWILDGGSATLDVRVGGKFHMEMMYKGKTYGHDGEYLEVDPPKRLVFTWVSEGTKGLPTVVTVELHDLGDRTEIVLTHEGLPDQKNADEHRGGWEEILVWLETKMLA